MKNSLFIAFLLFFSISAFAQSDANTFVFLENKGQITDSLGNPCENILFTTQKGDVKMLLSKTGIHYLWNRYYNVPSNSPKENIKAYKEELQNITKETYRLNVELVDANPNPIIQKLNPSSEYINYYNGFNNGITNIKQYSKIVYKDVYEGIDWVWYDNNGTIKYDFIVHAGADYRKIKFKVSGATKNEITKTGGLKIQTPFGEINEAPPISFLGKEQIPTYFSMEGDVVSFRIEENIGNKTLIIDPVLIWSTYYGGSDYDKANGVAVSNTDDVFLVGLTDSDNNIFFNGHQNKTTNFKRSSFVAKFDQYGKRIWATYFGGYDLSGTGRCFASSVAVDDLGNAYVVGNTNVADSIAKSGHQNTLGGKDDAYLAKFSASGSLLWATYYGGTEDEDGVCVKVTSNKVLLGGNTRSSNAIAKTNGTLNSLQGGQDVFLAAFDTAGTRQWGVYYGGPNNESLSDFDLDAKNDVAFTGSTNSYTGIFKLGSATYGGGISDAFVAKLLGGDNLNWGTYFGSTGDDNGVSIVVDKVSYAIFLLGKTHLSTTKIASTGSHKPNLTGQSDAFLVKFNPGGLRVWSTYVGGDNEEEAASIAINSNNDIFIAGTTSSTNGIFLNGMKQKSAAEWDIFICKFDKDGVQKWGTYYGDSASNAVSSLKTTPSNMLYFAGVTNSKTSYGRGGHQNSFGGGLADAFLSKISDTALFPLFSNVGPFCGELDYDHIVKKPSSLFEVKWYQKQTDSIPFFIGDTLTRLIDKTDTLWLCIHSTEYSSSKEPLITTILPSPKLKFSVSDTIMCEKGNQFVFSALNIDTLAIYKWDFGDGFLSSKLLDTHRYVNHGTFVPSLSGRYKTGSCNSTKSIVLKVLEIPTGQQITGTRSAPAGSIEAYNANNVIGSTYKWIITGGKQLTGGNSSSITVQWDSTGTSVGEVRVAEINNLNCEGFEVAINIFLSGLSTKNISKNFVDVYPNPASNFLIISSPLSKIDYILFDLTGRALYTGVVHENSKEEINLSEISAGTYYLKCQTESGLQSLKKVLVK